MLIATFNEQTGWIGKTIHHENEHFVLEGHGPISAADVLSYDDQGYLEWANDGTRAWVESRAAAPQAANAASTSADIGSTLASGWAKLAASAGVASVAVGKAAESAKASFSEGRAAAQSKADSVPTSPEASTSTEQTEEAAPAATPADTPVTSIADELAKLADLHAKGVLSDDEFAAYKAKLME